MTLSVRQTDESICASQLPVRTRGQRVECQFKNMCQSRYMYIVRLVIMKSLCTSQGVCQVALVIIHYVIGPLAPIHLRPETKIPKVYVNPESTI
jgi:hypothetical protein